MKFLSIMCLETNKWLAPPVVEHWKRDKLELVLFADLPTHIAGKNSEQQLFK